MRPQWKLQLEDDTYDNIARAQELKFSALAHRDGPPHAHFRPYDVTHGREDLFFIPFLGVYRFAGDFFFVCLRRLQ